MESLRDIAQRTDATVAAARAELVAAIREASRNGMTQTEIAREIGRSQPEVNRLLRFHGTGDRSMALRRAAPQVAELVRAAGGTNVRVFGSVATGEDTDDSDIDLLFTRVGPMGLLELSALERHLAELLGFDVDLVSDSSLRPDIKDEIIASAVQL